MQLTALLTERDKAAAWADEEQQVASPSKARAAAASNDVDVEEQVAATPPAPALAPAPAFAPTANQATATALGTRQNNIIISEGSGTKPATDEQEVTESMEHTAAIDPITTQMQQDGSKKWGHRHSSPIVPSAPKPTNRAQVAKAVWTKPRQRRIRSPKWRPILTRNRALSRPTSRGGKWTYTMNDFHGWTKVYVGFTVPIWELRGIQSGLERWAASEAQAGIDAFASVIGSGTGLMMIPILKPKKVFMYDDNAEGIKWGKLLCKLIQISASPQELVTRIFGRSVQDFEAANGKMKESNQDKYLDMVQDQSIFLDTLSKFAAADADAKEAYTKLLVNEISKGARKFQTVAGAKKEWTRCFYPMYLNTKGLLDTSNTKRTSDKIEVCRVLGYGMFYMRDQASYDAFKTTLAATKINWVKKALQPTTFASDVCSMVGPSQSTAINTMDIFAGGDGACHIFKGGENGENAVSQEMWRATAQQCGSNQLLWIQESSKNKLNNLQRIDISGTRGQVSIDDDYTRPSSDWKAFLSKDHYPDVAVARMQVEAAKYYEDNDKDDNQHTLRPTPTIQMQQVSTNADSNADLVRDLKNFFTVKMGVKPALIEPLAKAYNAVDRKYFFPSLPTKKVYDMEYGLRFGPKPASTTDGPWMFMNGLLRSLPYLQDKKKVLDIGTGSGHTSTVLAYLTGGEVWATEIDPDLIKKAQRAFAACMAAGDCDQSLVNKVHWSLPDSTTLLKANAPYDLIHGSTQRYQMGVNEKTKGTYITKWLREPKTREKQLKVPAAVLDQLAPNGVYIPYYYPDETIIVERNLKGELIADAIPSLISRSDASIVR